MDDVGRDDRGDREHSGRQLLQPAAAQRHRVQRDGRREHGHGGG
jgi:hypothetical protein